MSVGTGDFVKLQVYYLMTREKLDEYHIAHSTIELVEEFYQSHFFIWTKPSDIKNVFFIFREQDIIDKKYDCNGSRFCFLIRYYYHRGVNGDFTISPV